MDDAKPGQGVQLIASPFVGCDVTIIECNAFIYTWYVTGMHII
jgi:hypothetical protein